MEAKNSLHKITLPILGRLKVGDNVYRTDIKSRRFTITQVTKDKDGNPIISFTPNPPYYFHNHLSLRAMDFRIDTPTFNRITTELADSLDGSKEVFAKGGADPTINHWPIDDELFGLLRIGDCVYKQDDSYVPFQVQGVTRDTDKNLVRLYHPKVPNETVSREDLLEEGWYVLGAEREAILKRRSGFNQSELNMGDWTAKVQSKPFPVLDVNASAETTGVPTLDRYTLTGDEAMTAYLSSKERKHDSYEDWIRKTHLAKVMLYGLMIDEGAAVANEMLAIVKQQKEEDTNANH